MTAYNNFRDQFGQDDLFFIAMQPESGLTPAFFDTMNLLHTQLAGRLDQCRPGQLADQGGDGMAGWIEIHQHAAPDLLPFLRFCFPKMDAAP